MIINIFGPSGSGKTYFVRSLLKYKSVYKFYEEFSSEKQKENFDKKISITLLPLPKFRGNVEDLFSIFDLKMNSLINLSNELKNLSQSIFNKNLTYDNLNTISNRSLDTFSAGEIRRLFLLKTLMQDKSLLIIDEPFSNSDERIWELIFKSISCSTNSIVLSHIPLNDLFKSSKKIISININHAINKFNMK